MQSSSLRSHPRALCNSQEDKATRLSMCSKAFQCGSIPGSSSLLPLSLTHTHTHTHTHATSTQGDSRSQSTSSTPPFQAAGLFSFACILRRQPALSLPYSSSPGRQETRRHLSNANCIGHGSYDALLVQHTRTHTPNALAIPYAPSLVA